MSPAAPAGAGAVSVAGVPVRAAIVDLDGTMVDTLGDFLVALRGMLGELGLGEVTPEQVAQRVGKGSEHLVAQVLRLHLPAQQADALHPRALRVYQQHYTQANGRHSELFPGVLEGLRRLRDAAEADSKRGRVPNRGNEHSRTPEGMNCGLRACDRASPLALHPATPRAPRAQSGCARSVSRSASWRSRAGRSRRSRPRSRRS